MVPVRSMVFKFQFSCPARSRFVRSTHAPRPPSPFAQPQFPTPLPVLDATWFGCPAPQFPVALPQFVRSGSPGAQFVPSSPDLPHWFPSSQFYLHRLRLRSVLVARLCLYLYTPLRAFPFTHTFTARTHTHTRTHLHHTHTHFTTFAFTFCLYLCYVRCLTPFTRYPVQFHALHVLPCRFSGFTFTFSGLTYTRLFYPHTVTFGPTFTHFAARCLCLCRALHAHAHLYRALYHGTFTFTLPYPPRVLRARAHAHFTFVHRSFTFALPCPTPPPHLYFHTHPRTFAFLPLPLPLPQVLPPHLTPGLPRSARSFTPPGFLYPVAALPHLYLVRSHVRVPVVGWLWCCSQFMVRARHLPLLLDTYQLFKFPRPAPVLLLSCVPQFSCSPVLLLPQLLSSFSSFVRPLFPSRSVTPFLPQPFPMP